MARTQGHGNPKWTRDETILALELYLDASGTVPSNDDPRVIALSVTLARLPDHATERRMSSFRNPDGVAFKLQNIRRVATGKGLAHIARMDRQVWDELGRDPQEVRRLAALIRDRGL